MLNLIFGTAKSGKTNRIYELLKENAAQGIDAALFVPEQFSFENERKIIDTLGYNNAQILSFSRLCDEIKRLYGGSAGKIIDDSLRFILMSRVIKSISHEFKLFKNNSASATNSIINSMNEFKTAGIPCDVMFSVAKNLGESVLSNKLHDIALATSTYNAVLMNKYLDPIDDLTNTYNKVLENGYFKGKTIYFNLFNNFTGQQLKIVKQAIIDADNVYIAFCSDYKNTDDKFSVFANVNATAKKLINFANDERIKVNIDVLENKENSFTNIENYFKNQVIDNKNNENIKVFNLSNKYDECEFAARYIHKNIRENGTRYKEYSIVCRNTNDYKNIIKPIFSKYNIPIFINEKHILCESLVCIFALLCLNASRNYKTDSILKLIKTGLTNISDNDLLELDNYLYLWNIDGKAWLDEWKFNPFGLRELSDKRKELAENQLTKLNAIRQEIIKPLIKLNKLKRGTARDFSECLFNVIEDYNLSNNLSSIIKKLELNSDYESIQFQTSSWDAFIAIIDNIVETYEDEEITFGEFRDILNTCFLNTEISGIPQGLDEVSLTTPEKLDSEGINTTIVLGVNDGSFPATKKSIDLFNPSERAFLANYEIQLNDNYISNTIEENFLAYRTFTSPKNDLIITYHSGNYSSGKTEISNLLESLCKELNLDIKKVNPNEFNFDNIETAKQAFSLASANLSEFTAEKLLLKLAEYDDFSNIVNSIYRAKKEFGGKISYDTVLKLYGKDIKCYPSTIEQYFKCPYSYFCKYGLNLNKREKIDFKVMQRGTISHYVLEKLLSEHINDLSKFKGNSEDIINKYIDEYISLTVGDIDLLDNHSLYILSRIKDMLKDLIDYIIDELDNSEFKPCEFELRIGDDGKIPPVIIDSQVGKVTLGGVVDRVDKATINNKNYIRIVDYKTGKKDFEISDVLYGLNLQMLIYLCAICENSDSEFSPAGIIYQPLNPLDIKGISKKEISNSPKAKGILINNKEILEKMDPKGQYMPFKFNKDGTLSKSSLCISHDQFKEIFAYIKKTVARMHKEVAEGNIDKNPCANDNKHKICSYCEYKDTCRTFYANETKSLENVKIDEFFERIKGGEIND